MFTAKVVRRHFAGEYYTSTGQFKKSTWTSETKERYLQQIYEIELDLRENIMENQARTIIIFVD